MKRFILPAVAFSLFTFTSCNILEMDGFSSMTVCFEEMNLGEAGYISSAPYVSSESIVTFANSYNQEYGSYEGFAFSSLTDRTTPGYANQFSVFADGGAESSKNFAVYYYNTFESALEGKKIFFKEGIKVDLESVCVNNSTYVALSILNGSDFSRKFQEGDWFLLTIEATDVQGAKHQAEFYLADYRDGNNYVCDQWNKIDLSAMKDIVSVDFILTSSDNGEFGMNTPAYFCLDNFKFKYKLPVE